MRNQSRQHVNAAQSPLTPTPYLETLEVPTSGGTKLLLTPQEAADALGINRCTLYTLIMSGEIPSLKIGRRRCIPLKALEEWIVTQLAA